MTSKIQTLITESKNYKIERISSNYSEIQPYLYIEGTGTVNIYGRDVAAVSDSNKVSVATGFGAGYYNFNFVGDYLRIEQATAGTRTIYIVGIKITEV